MKISLTVVGGVCLAALLFVVTQEKEPAPAASLSLGAPQRIVAPAGSATAGSDWLEFPVILANAGTSNIWTEGYRDAFPFYGISTRRAVAEEWHALEGGFCGTGSELYTIAPGERQAFTVAVPIEYAGQQIKVTIAVTTNQDCRSVFEIASDPAQIPN